MAAVLSCWASIPVSDQGQAQVSTRKVHDFQGRQSSRRQYILGRFRPLSAGRRGPLVIKASLEETPSTRTSVVRDLKRANGSPEGAAISAIDSGEARGGRSRSPMRRSKEAEEVQKEIVDALTVTTLIFVGLGLCRGLEALPEILEGDLEKLIKLLSAVDPIIVGYFAWQTRGGLLEELRAEQADQCTVEEMRTQAFQSLSKFFEKANWAIGTILVATAVKVFLLLLPILGSEDVLSDTDKMIEVMDIIEALRA